MATKKKSGLLRRMFSSLFGKNPTAEPVYGRNEAALIARIATLEMDLQERDERITAMQREYSALSESMDRQSARVGQAQLEKTFKRLSGNLSTLAALIDLADSGREVDLHDVVVLFRVIERDFAAAGMERIGSVGEVCAFDPAVHSRMSGGAVSAGTVVTVHVPGYRMGRKILLKALVTPREATHA